MLTAAVVLLAAASAAFAALVFRYLQRAARARRELAIDIHDRALGLDRRCDFLGDVLFAVKERHDVLQRIDHLFDLVACAEAEERLPAPAARSLRRYALELRAEALAAAPDPDDRKKV